MIRLEKTAEPPILTENAAAWTATVLNKLQSGEQPTPSEKARYSHPEIKAALVAETHGKCAYCESKLRHVAYGDIEHVVPKSRSAELWFSWANLTLACDVCNTKKSDAPVGPEEFVDPYLVDPELEFWHMGAVIFARPGHEAASLTEKLLGLNRAELLERRGERLASLMKLLDVVEGCANPALKLILWQDFCREAASEKEYAALARFVLAFARGRLGY